MSEEIERLEKLVRDGFTAVLAKLEDVETEIRSLRGEVPDEPEPDPIREPEPEPEPEPVDPDTYVFDTNNLPEVWTHKPSNGSDVLQLQSGVEMPLVPQRPVDSYSLQLWLTGHPVEKRNVLAWMVAGTGVAGDNDQKFSSLVWVDAKKGKVKWRMGFGVNEEEQIPTEVLAPWAPDQEEFSVKHAVRLVNPRDSKIASPTGGDLHKGTPPIGIAAIKSKGIHIDLGDRDGASPVGATYTRVRVKIRFV